MAKPDSGPANEHATSMHHRVYLLTVAFIAFVTILFAMAMYVAEVMDNVRAYIRGENLWAKAQFSAVNELYRYVYTGDVTHLDAFYDYLTVNEGDRQARETLQSDAPDLAIAFDGFSKGGNHPDDIPGLISFFRNYQSVYYLEKAITIWSEADVLIGELKELAVDIQGAVQGQRQNELDRLLIELESLDVRLREKELDFSVTLGQGARWIKSTLVIVNIVLVSVLLIIAIYLTRNMAKQLKNTEKNLRISDLRFNSLFRSDVIGIVEFHTDGRIVETNQRFLDIIGYGSLHADKVASDLNWRSLTPVDYKASDDLAMAELDSAGASTPYDKQYFHADGHRVPVMIGSVLLTGIRDTGLSFVIDQSEKYRMEQELRLSAIVMEHSQDGIVILDEDQRTLSVNNAFCELSRMQSIDVEGKKIDITHDRMEEEQRISITQALVRKDNWEGDIDFLTAENELVPVRLSISIVEDEQHEYGQYVLMFSDIKSRKAAEERLRQLANFDTLTGIANRSLFQSRLNRAIGRAKRHRMQCAVMFIDLNKFKPVNDHFGHEIGDGLLVQVADRLKQLMRTVDTVARIGGDEFVVIIEDVDSEDVIQDVALRIISSIAQPFYVKSIELSVTCSIGISIYPMDGLNDIELTRAADIAMYAAKSSGEGRYYFFNSQISNSNNMNS